jgi:hypothetical protein
MHQQMTQKTRPRINFMNSWSRHTHAACPSQDVKLKADFIAAELLENVGSNLVDALHAVIQQAIFFYFYFPGLGFLNLT